ncbi:MAG: cytochrome c [Alphaproteobacteria bacterium]|jgi:mono/diheme cytochrome c family protein
MTTRIRHVVRPVKMILRATVCLPVLTVVAGLSAAPALAQEIREPEMTGTLATGRLAFTAKCAACHGTKGQGTDKGPPFLSRIYHPGHHGDEAFRLAARNGARAHHWPFGNMPPVEGLSDAQLDQVIAYIRALQRANGVF